MSIYKNWGFKENPFNTSALGPDLRGQKLLIGRKSETRQFKQQLTNPPKLPTLEGANGVGKTSLANVATFELYEDYFNQLRSELYVPCRKTFQIPKDSFDPELFTFDVLAQVAQTLIERAEELKRFNSTFPNTKQIDSWLNAPQLKSWQGSAWAIGGGLSTQQNTSAGFERNGFNNAVQEFLKKIFPEEWGGGVVCVLDNLELLQETKKARQMLEQLRDTLFIIPGLRWILCGANGIMHSVVSSPRLEGFLHNPIEIGGVGNEHVKDVLLSRVKALSPRPEDSYLPLTADDFELLYKILNNNLRSALGRADNYCDWSATQTDIKLKSDAEKTASFHKWITSESNKVLTDVENQIGARAWEIFHKALELGGSFSPSDFAVFACASPQALRPLVKELEDVQMVISLKEDSDKRRKTIQITPKGFFVAYARARRFGKDLPR